MTWLIGGDYDNWLTTEPTPRTGEDDPRDDEPVDFGERDES